jgi:hypothetical protein
MPIGASILQKDKHLRGGMLTQFSLEVWKKAILLDKDSVFL